MGEKRGMKGLEVWCKRVTSGYPNVKVENMTTSWRNGLAFCALIHHFRPDLIDFYSLKKDDIYKNNELAFRVAEECLGIPALLDAEDMVRCEVPDRLSILTYLSQFYQTFVGSQQGSASRRTVPKRPASLADRVLPPIDSSPPAKVVPRALSVGRREPCVKCGMPVFIAERLIVDSRSLYHRTCFRCARCQNQLSLANYYETEDGRYCCETCPDEVGISPTHKDANKDIIGQLNFEDSAKNSENTDSDIYSSTFEASLEDKTSTPRSDRKDLSFKSSFSKARSSFMNDLTSETKTSSPTNTQIKNGISSSGSVSENTNKNKPKYFVGSQDLSEPEMATTPSDNVKSVPSEYNVSIKLSDNVSSPPSTDDMKTSQTNDTKELENTKSIVKRRLKMFENNSSSGVDRCRSAKFNEHRNYTVYNEDENSNIFDVEKSEKEESSNVPVECSNITVINTSLESINRNSLESSKLVTDTSLELSSVPLVESSLNKIESDNISDVKEDSLISVIEDSKEESKDSKEELKDSKEESTDSEEESKDSKEGFKDSIETNLIPNESQSVKLQSSVIVCTPSSIKHEVQETNKETRLESVEDIDIKRINECLPDNESKSIEKCEQLDVRENMLIPDTIDEKLKENKHELKSEEICKISEVEKEKNTKEEEAEKKMEIDESSKDIASDEVSEESHLKQFDEKPQKNLEKELSHDHESKKNESHVKEKKLYPRTLNPFEDDNEEPAEVSVNIGVIKREQKKASLNPFESSDDDEDAVTDESSEKKVVSAPKVNLNPFWSDGEEPSSEEEALKSQKPPVPLPRTVKNVALEPSPRPRRSEGITGSISSLSSLGSSVGHTSIGSGRKKKKPAPAPPSAKESASSSRASSPSSSLSHSSPRPRHRKNRAAPPPPTSTESIDTLKNEKDAANRHKQNSNTLQPVVPNKSTYGQWKRKKAPAPPRPLPQKRQTKAIPLEEVKRELDDIEVRQQELERQGVKLEQTIRAKFEQDDTSNQDDSFSPDVEDLILHLFELVNEKNELFRRQAELMYLRRQQRLEEEHADLEYQIRCLIEQPEHTKTDSDKAREEELIQRLVEVVERRNEIVDCLEMDRKREADEDRSIHSHMEKFAAKGRSSEPDVDTNKKADKEAKKDKEKKKHKKEKKLSKKKITKVVDADKDIDEVEESLAAQSKEKKSKKRWFH